MRGQQICRFGGSVFQQGAVCAGAGAQHRQEVALLTSSRVNDCSCCMAPHSMIADRKAGILADSPAALREGHALPDAKLEAATRFAAAMVETRGNQGKANVDAHLQPHALTEDV